MAKSMATNGVDAAGAVTILIELGETVKSIARQCSVNLATVYRWRNGVQPRERGWLALRELVFNVHRQVTAAPKLDRVKDQKCRTAIYALMTNTARDAEADLIARINATPPAPFIQPAAARTVPVGPYRSVTRQVDAFALANSGPRQLEISF